MRSEDRLVELLASVLFQRELDLAAQELTAAEDAAADARAEELTGDLAGDGGKRATLKRVGSAVWRLGRALWGVEDELDKRPHGRFYHQWLGLLPVVGVVGKYLGSGRGSSVPPSRPAPGCSTAGSPEAPDPPVRQARGTR